MKPSKRHYFIYIASEAGKLKYIIEIFLELDYISLHKKRIQISMY
jgi:hypothetical protein